VGDVARCTLHPSTVGRRRILGLPAGASWGWMGSARPLGRNRTRTESRRRPHQLLKDGGESGAAWGSRRCGRRGSGVVAGAGGGRRGRAGPRSGARDARV
jgi:hypothetical protein